MVPAPRCTTTPRKIRQTEEKPTYDSCHSIVLLNKLTALYRPHLPLFLGYAPQLSIAVLELYEIYIPTIIEAPCRYPIAAEMFNEMYYTTHTTTKITPYNRYLNPASCCSLVGALFFSSIPLSSRLFCLVRYILVAVAHTIAITLAARFTLNAVR